MSESAGATKPRIPTKCLIYPLPKIVFFYPTMVVSFLAAMVSTNLEKSVVPQAVAFGYYNKGYIEKEGLLEGKEEQTTSEKGRTIPKLEGEMKKTWREVAASVYATDAAHGVHPEYLWGWIFLIVFVINILVISFDFPGVKALMVAFLVLAVIFGGALLNQKIRLIGFLADMFGAIKPYATNHFYFVVGVVLALIIMSSVFVNRYWNKWIIEGNRLVHKHGMFGDVREWPTLNIQFHKEINDVFEYVLLRSGRLVFHPSGAHDRPIVLENVPFVTSKELKIRKILETWQTTGGLA